MIRILPRDDKAVGVEVENIWCMIKKGAQRHQGHCFLFSKFLGSRVEAQRAGERERERGDRRELCLPIPLLAWFKCTS